MPQGRPPNRSGDPLSHLALRGVYYRFPRGMFQKNDAAAARGDRVL